MKLILAAASIGIAALGASAIANVSTHRAWEIGPIIRGKNYSVGMPLRPRSSQEGWYFDFPYPSRKNGHVHYVTFAPESLANKSRIRVRYRVRAPAGTRFVPQEQPDRKGTVSLYFQRCGDNWSAKGRYSRYRWYAPDDTVQKLAPGTHMMVVELDDPSWRSVIGGGRSGSDPEMFNAALDDAARVGLVFGSLSARGHGVFATAPAQFELLSFKIE